jgi:ubiquinone/menaquinone biosynthesis C-methylase UbiE
VCFSRRQPEGSMVDESALGIFSRVSSLTARAAGNRVKHILGGLIKQDMTVIDIGTGPGTIPLNLKRLFPRAHFIGIDISKEMISMARGHAARSGLHLPVLVGDGQSLPFGTDKADCVISFFAMHHMDHPQRLLAEIDRVLKPGGALLIIDFRRDIKGLLFGIINAAWQAVFFLSAARRGFGDSVRSAWLPLEIEDILKQGGIGRFKVRTNRLELCVTT